MVIATTVQKGGCGKTTTVACLAQAAAYKKQKVLVVDLDAQGNCTFALGGKTSGTNAMDFLTGSKHAIHTVSPFIDIVPSSKDLVALTTETGSARRLQKALAPVKDNYDLVIIDTPPHAGEAQYNSLMAADYALIPLAADIFNVQSLIQIAGTIQTIRESNKGLQVLGVLITNYDGRSTLAKDMREAIEDQAQTMGIPTLGAIRSGIAIREAAALQRSLFEYAPKSKPAADYMSVYEQITNRR